MAKKVIKKARSAETGQYIPMEKAKKNPRTTVVEKEKAGHRKRRK